MYPVIIDPLISSQAKKLVSDNSLANDFFGRSVSLFENTLAVGAIGDAQIVEKAGAVYIFEQDTGGTKNWGQVKKITASDASSDDFFGVSVAIHHDLLDIGASGYSDLTNSSIPSGSAYIFERHSGGTDNWVLVKNSTPLMVLHRMFLADRSN